MKNNSSANNAAVRCAALKSQLQLNAGRNLSPRQWKIARAFFVSALLLGVALMPTISPFAQKRKDNPYSVTGVSSRKTNDSTVVTVSADSPLNRTQTWQDEEGFHMSLPDASAASLKGLPRGVIVRNLGKTLEVVVAVKPGTSVTVDPQFNRLNLIVKGNVDMAQGGAQLAPQTKAPIAQEQTGQPLDYEQSVSQPRGRRSQVESARPLSAPAGGTANALTPNTVAPAEAIAPASQTSTTSAGSSAQVVPANGQAVAPARSQTAVVADPAALGDQSEGGIFSYLFSITGMLVMLLLGLVAFVVVRRRQDSQGWVSVSEEKDTFTEPLARFNPLEPLTAVQETSKKERRNSGRREDDQALSKESVVGNQEATPPLDAAMEKRPVAAPVQPALYGAYRVDQEVGKLVLGQAHRMDVLSSRAPDDRRAIETSLLKAMNAPESNDEGRRRAREALEEYGFVARQCASLLLAHNAYDRASAARALGGLNSKSSLPFLLEALYDAETIVRTEAVMSLGTLKIPSAIGALLDMARRHPEMPAALLTNALTACSVECFDFFDISTSDRLLLDTGDGDVYRGEITHLDSAAAVEALPEWFEDEELSEALGRLRHSDVEARAAAARRLAQFHVQRSVEALTSLAADDPEPVVRSAAVTSLGEIEHESVFGAVLMAFADEAREVRAAAARSLSRMSFDRADGYVRLIETANDETLRRVASASIKAGMVGQAIERLISEDRRLAYEAFSLLSLLVKANETEPLMDAIANHPEMSVRLALIRLSGSIGQPELATQFRYLAVREGIPENISTALMEVVYKIDQAQPV